MGRRLRPTVPILPALLEPALPDGDMVLLKEKERCTTLQSATPRMETQQTHSWAGRVGHRQLELSSEVTPHLVRIWWRDPTGSSGETVAISSSYSFHLNKSTVMQLSRSQAVFQNDLQQNNLQQHHRSRMFQSHHLLLLSEPGLGELW